ncbi:chloride channel, nucleotide-sensitive, 1A, putative [Eimeria brunetti]|uniref:Chloride channel, nucleotide-sensitive, 1A, putative n=1 Tax=Eimeria brunetti TaxID=51314 RepID=U6LMB0_9EIME|nr:chloride channel, nucleotide-sensitive, 1A, putative [Eimeria brunetti]
MMARAPHRTTSGDLELQDNEAIGIRVPCASVVIGGKDSGRGELFVTSQRVAWLSDNGPSFALAYVSIVLHALSTDPQACDRPCLYCQIKGEALPDIPNGNPVGISTSDSAEASEDAEGVAHDDPMVELKFIPDDSSCLQRLFTVMSDMAALHPDPDSGALDGDEDELYDEAALRRQGWEFVENDGDAAGGNGGVDA